MPVYYTGRAREALKTGLYCIIRIYNTIPSDAAAGVDPPVVFYRCSAKRATGTASDAGNHAPHMDHKNKPFKRVLSAFYMLPIQDYTETIKGP